MTAILLLSMSKGMSLAYLITMHSHKEAEVHFSITNLAVGVRYTTFNRTLRPCWYRDLQVDRVDNKSSISTMVT